MLMLTVVLWFCLLGGIVSFELGAQGRLTCNAMAILMVDYPEDELTTGSSSWNKRKFEYMPE